MFLYESLWDAASCLVLLWFTRRYWRRVPPSTIFALYVTLYCLLRLPLETMKVDPADHIFGQRLNVWVAGIGLIIGVVWFVIAFRRRGPEPEPALASAHPEPSHVPTTRPEAAIAARRASQQRRKH
jgi:prolipoprotein diacylglyceryltransferase